MLTKEHLQGLRKMATGAIGSVAVSPTVLLQMLYVCDAHAKLAVRCTDCSAHLAAMTCVCADCQKRRDCVPKPNEPNRAGTFWHKCAFEREGEPDWHPVKVQQSGARLVAYHLGDDRDDEVAELAGEWGRELLPPVASTLSNAAKSVLNILHLDSGTPFDQPMREALHFRLDAQWGAERVEAAIREIEA